MLKRILFLAASIICLLMLTASAFSDTIIDNGEQGTSFTGNWYISGGSDPYITDSMWSRDGATYSWAFEPGVPGTYEILMWWSRYASRASNIPVDIAADGAVDTVHVNQRENAGQWNLLGTFTVDLNASVTITAVDGASYSSCADAVWFRFVSGNELPVANIDSIEPNPANVGQTVQFAGHGTSDNSAIIEYEWSSDIDGVLSSAASFSMDFLSEGMHAISFRVKDAEGLWSEVVEQNFMIGDPPLVYIIDNGDPETSTTGSWSVSGGSTPYGDDSLWSRDGATYTWSFSPLVSDYYTVSMWWSQWPSRSTDVPAAIEHADGIKSFSVNQQEGTGQWNKMAELYFEAGNTYDVTITADYGSTVSTCADAVKFERVNLNSPPIAAFSSDITTGGSPLNVQFIDQSSGAIDKWAWDFGDGYTSVEQNPTHEYNRGMYTVSLTVSNTFGSDQVTRTGYITVHDHYENIYIADGYSQTSLESNAIKMLNRIGAVENNGVWTYTTADKTFYIRIVRDPVTLENALREDGSHIVYNGHSNFGFGGLFASEEEFISQEVLDLYYIDDERFTNYSTDMVSTKVDGMRYGQAFPNWSPVFQDGTSGIMPYDFTEGTPPYNYLYTYTIPGDPMTYKVELSDGSFLERFPDAKTPAWYSPNGTPPDPQENSEYFITNPNPYWEKCELSGNWPFGKVLGAGFTGDGGYLGYNYQYHSAGAGYNTATWTLVIENPDYYAVMASWRALDQNATDAKYVIQHADGTDIVEVDQTESELTNMLGIHYFNEGVYTIQLSDDANGQVVADAIVLQPTSNPERILQADFAVDAASGSAPHDVSFTDTSLYFSSDVLASDIGIQQWHWDFGDGSTSTQQNPTHTYANSGVYTVSLLVTDELSNEDTEIKKSLIVVGNAGSLIEAEFSAKTRLGADQTIVNFTDQSSGILSEWHWDFGDGETSNEQNPMHVYTTPGIYTVALTVYGPAGNDSEIETDFIYNNIGMMFIDNTFKVKPHFNSGSPVKFGKVICDTGDIKIPEDELGYSRIFYNSCNSCSYYAGTFHRGKMFCSTSDTDVPTASVTYVENYLKGWNDAKLLGHLNNYIPVFEFIDFTAKPPSMR